MPEGDVIRDLLRSHVHEDEEGFRNAAKLLIEGERRRNHRLLADDLERILFQIPNKRRLNGKASRKPTDVPRDKDKGFPLLTMRSPETSWDRLILDPVVAVELEKLMEEHRRAELLASAGLNPKRRVLFCGPPGCGKTVTAEVMAHELCLPLVTVRLDTVVSSFLGETASNLRKIFEFVAGGSYVVLFDEFDALGKERNRDQDHGELQRVVNALLQLIDAYSGESLIIFATNHQKMLDEALWRRFELIIPFEMPSNQDRVLMLRQWLGSFSIPDAQISSLARLSAGCSGSDVRWLAMEVIRRAVIDARSKIEKTDIEAAKKSFDLRQQAITASPNSQPRRKKASISKKANRAIKRPQKSPSKKTSLRKAKDGKKS